jgi:hypothetical protein
VWFRRAAAAVVFAGLRRSRRVARVANNVEGIDDGVGRGTRGDVAREERGERNRQRRRKCNGAPRRKALNEVRTQSRHPTSDS